MSDPGVAFSAGVVLSLATEAFIEPASGDHRNARAFRSGAVFGGLVAIVILLIFP